MGRHTAPIMVITAATAAAVGATTDPRLLDRPIATGAARRAARPAGTSSARRWVTSGEETDGIDETPVDVVPISVHSVLEAEEAAAASELPERYRPKLRDLLFAGASLAVLVVAVTSTLTP